MEFKRPNISIDIYINDIYIDISADFETFTDFQTVKEIKIMQNSFLFTFPDEWRAVRGVREGGRGCG